MIICNIYIYYILYNIYMCIYYILYNIYICVYIYICNTYMYINIIMFMHHYIDYCIWYILYKVHYFSQSFASIELQKIFSNIIYHEESK